MMRALCLLLLVAGVARSEEVQRLGLLSYDPYDHTLSWSVEYGQMEGDKFKASRARKCKIDFHPGGTFDNPMMECDGKKLPFTTEEAEFMHEALQAFVVRYAVESTEWFDKGGPIHRTPRSPKKKPGIQASLRH
jgi:hypothetical protein